MNPLFATLLGPLSRKREPETPPDIEAAALRSDRFRLERETDWRRLDDILTRMEKGRLRSVPDADILALPTLYRTAASSLAVARETSLDAGTLAYLEALVQRAWFQVYGPRNGFAGWLRQFFGGGWSRAVRAMWLDICIALAAMVTGTITGWLLVSRDNEWFYSLVDPGMAGERVPGASRETLLATLGQKDDAAGLSTFAAQLFVNNAGVCILAFALGFAFGIPSLLLLVQNMALLGALWWVFASQGLGSRSRRLAQRAWHDRTARHPAGGRGGAAYRAQHGVSRRPQHHGRDERERTPRGASDGGRGHHDDRRRIAGGVSASTGRGQHRALYHRGGVRNAMGGVFRNGGQGTPHCCKLRRRRRWKRRVSKPQTDDARAKTRLETRAALKRKRRREIVTPEGVTLPVTIASRGGRAGALVLDFVLIVSVWVASTLFALWLDPMGMQSGGSGSGSELIPIVYVVIVFLARYAYFLYFELGPRGATPGKRAVGIRVAAYGGGRLTAEAVLARNLLRDIELFLPIIFIVSAPSGQTGNAGIAAAIWFLIFALFPFFNRDGLRAGDLVAGTWVVEAPRAKLLAPLATQDAAAGTNSTVAARYEFAMHELEIYGEYELQTLEKVLRSNDTDTIAAVQSAICRKIGWNDGAGDGAGDGGTEARAFLEAFYAQLRARLEGDMRFGKRKADKFS